MHTPEVYKAEESWGPSTFLEASDLRGTKVWRDQTSTPSHKLLAVGVDSGKAHLLMSGSWWSKCELKMKIVLFLITASRESVSWWYVHSNYIIKYYSSVIIQNSGLIVITNNYGIRLVIKRRSLLIQLSQTWKTHFGSLG